MDIFMNFLSYTFVFANFLVSRGVASENLGPKGGGASKKKNQRGGQPEKGGGVAKIFILRGRLLEKGQMEGGGVFGFSKKLCLHNLLK